MPAVGTSYDKFGDGWVVSAEEFARIEAIANSSDPLDSSVGVEYNARIEPKRLRKLNEELVLYDESVVAEDFIGDLIEMCDACKGNGWGWEWASDMTYEDVSCPICDGVGFVFDE